MIVGRVDLVQHRAQLPLTNPLVERAVGNHVVGVAGRRAADAVELRKLPDFLGERHLAQQRVDAFVELALRIEPRAIGDFWNGGRGG